MGANYSEEYLMKSTEATSYQDFENRKRLENILDMIGKIAALDFSVELTPSNKNDIIDAISLGLNMLSEELNSNVVERAKLDAVNKKLEKFAYTTAHDLKSPLNSITGLILLLEMSLTNESYKARECITKLREVTDRMKSLISGILDYSKIATGIKKEEVDLNALFNEVISLDGIGENADVRIIGKLPKVLFNQPSLIQIVRNLLSNAVNHSDKEACKITVEAVETSDHYQISVSDNGPGIDHENHEKIFELFTKINSNPKLGNSHGIGLATIRGILESEGERIWVESILGRGAKFNFTLKKYSIF